MGKHNQKLVEYCVSTRNFRTGCTTGDSSVVESNGTVTFVLAWDGTVDVGEYARDRGIFAPLGLVQRQKSLYAMPVTDEHFVSWLWGRAREPLADIANALGLPVSTVESRLKYLAVRYSAVSTRLIAPGEMRFTYTHGNRLRLEYGMVDLLEKDEFPTACVVIDEADRIAI